MFSTRAVFLLLLLVSSGLPGNVASADVPGTVAPVVESVEPGGAAATAGLEPGDVVRWWSREPGPPANPQPARGEPVSPFDLRLVEMEQAPRGTVTLGLDRDGTPLELELPHGEWKLRTRPALSLAEQAAYAELGDPEQAGAGLRRLAEAARRRGDHLVAAWFELRAVQQAAASSESAGTVASCSGAAATAAAAPEGALARSFLLEACGTTLTRHRRLEAAARCQEAALALRQELSDPSLAVAASHNELGLVAWHRGDMVATEAFFRRAFEIREALAPGSVVHARSYWNLALVAQRGAQPQVAADWFRCSIAILEERQPGGRRLASTLDTLARLEKGRGDLRTAEQLLLRELEIRTQLDQETIALVGLLDELGSLATALGNLDEARARYCDSLDLRVRLQPADPGIATNWVNLGIIAHRRGDIGAAEALYRDGVVLAEALAPDGPSEANARYHLGIVAHERGDLASAESHCRHALELYRTLDPGGLDLARTLQELGALHLERGDLTAAQDDFLAALQIIQSLAPDSSDAAWAFNNLGKVAQELGDLGAAWDYHTKALAIRERIDADSPYVATTLAWLGELATMRRQFPVARRNLERALDICRRRLPGDSLEAHCLRRIGLLAEEEGRYDEARAHLRRALGIRTARAPGSYDEAEALQDLARLERQGQRLDRAIALSWKATAILDAQRGRIGGSVGSRATFRARFLRCYQELVEMLVDAGRPEEAFAVLERSRGHSLLSMLAERDLVFAADLPAELEHRRRLTATEYDRLQARANRADRPEQAEELRRALRQLRDQQQQIAEDIRRSSPRLADLQYPQPLDVEGARAALDEGTALLSYALSERHGYLFVISRAQGLSTIELAIDEARARNAVQELRAWLKAGSAPQPDSTVLRHQARRLYDLLLAPAEPLVADAERLLICPDGALHTLPWGALVRHAGDGGEQYLVEWKPVHTVISATLYAQLARKRPARRFGATTRVAAFGDPLLDATTSDELTALPAARTEVAGVAAVWGESAQTWVGAEATEERAKAIGSSADIVHFACHARLDRYRPLDSALVLAAPAEPGTGENGRLQSWEILEQVRLEADLVVLSACDTALGGYLRGEGLISLTRAFQYAGARSIVASLWTVPDESTAELMHAFHAGLRHGLSTDEALRHAQLQLIRGRDRAANGTTVSIDPSHPYAWAGFTLIGDWW